MKKKLFMFVSMMMFFLISHGQVSLGDFTLFPNSSLWRSAYKPQLAIGKFDSLYVLCLRYVSPKTYASFDKESVILLKMGDDTNIKLPIVKEIDVVRKYDIIGSSDLYITFSFYLITDNVLKKIMEDKSVIKKIRASFTNGDVEDWEIKEKYQPKLIKGLYESYQQVEAQDAIRKEKIIDVEAGF